MRTGSPIAYDVVVERDVRGRHGSDGDWAFLGAHEAAEDVSLAQVVGGGYVAAGSSIDQSVAPARSFSFAVSADVFALTPSVP